MKRNLTCLWLVFCLFFGGVAQAQEESKLKEKDYSAELKTGPKVENPIKILSKYHDLEGNLLPQYQNRSTASITVNYGPGFTTQAQQAFQHAVDIWASILNSDVTIRINATWQPGSSASNLGSAGSGYSWRNNSNFPLSNTWYPASLADALASTDLDPSEFDINANFNSTRSDWYFGTDANPATDEYDLATVVLHEIGHGLGFSGSAGSDGTAAGSSILAGSPANPRIWDTFIENAAGTPITSYTSGTNALLSQLIGGNLFFDGFLADAANGNTPIEIYAPNPWDGGSSFSHMDEAAYPDYLMTPFLSPGVAIHDISDIEKGILLDMGWSLEEEECDNTSAHIQLQEGFDLFFMDVDSKGRLVFMRNGNLCDKTFIFQDNGRLFQLRNNIGSEKLRMQVISTGEGFVKTIGENNGDNVRMSYNSSNGDLGFVGVRNVANDNRVEAYASTTGPGFWGTRGENNNFNVRLSNLSGSPDNGFVSIRDSDNTTQAGFYVDSNGDGVVFADVKNFRVEHPTKPNKDIWYACMEGPEVAAYERGSAQLVNGQAQVNFSEEFRLLSNTETMTIIVNPNHWDTFGLAVVEKTSTGFRVEELKEGSGNFTFDWEVKCVRKGYENFQVIRDKDSDKETDINDKEGQPE